MESQVGRGTRFELYLPACGEAGGDAKGEAEEPAGRGQGELILVVDDEAGVRLALRHTLEKYGYRVVLAEDGAAALALFGRVGGEVRAVVTDMMMPNLDGLMLARVLRRSRPELPIVGMTGLVEQVDRKELEEVGVATLLQKPFPAVKFLAAVREALAGKGES